MVAEPRIIPIHNFTVDDHNSISFRFINLEKKLEYDSSQPHRHNYYEIFLFIRGGGNHLIDFNNFTIRDNSIHFVSPGQVHLVKRNLDSEGFLIQFSRDFFYSGITDHSLLQNHPLLNNRSVNPIINPGSESFKWLLDIFLRMRAELNNRDEYYNNLLRLYLNEFLYKSLQFIPKENPPQPSVTSRFFTLLEKNFYQWHLVKQYASELGITEKSLSELLKESTGLTTTDHIAQRLVLEAKRLLQYSEMNIKEISYQIGFEDPSHFAKFFKNTTGSTPSEYRQNTA